MKRRAIDRKILLKLFKVSLQNIKMLDLTVLSSILTLNKAFFPCLNIDPTGCTEDLQVKEVQLLPSRSSYSLGDCKQMDFDFKREGEPFPAGDLRSRTQ